MTTAATLVRRWVDLYTRGVPTDLRDARRAEIESDLWAQSEEADDVGRTPLSLGTEMLTRLALGIPADISWRQSHRAGVASNRKETAMRAPGSHRVLNAIGLVWAALFVALASAGLVSIQQNPNADPPGDVLMASVLAVTIIVGAALALVGLLRIGRSPTTGRTMALVGAAIAGGSTIILLSWMWIVAFVMALPLAVIGLVRARQVMQAGPQQPA